MQSHLVMQATWLCFQSSEIYVGLKSAYDYGPLGVELKRNLMNAWWRDTVHSREDVVGLDASIIMHPKVWQASDTSPALATHWLTAKSAKSDFAQIKPQL